MAMYGSVTSDLEAAQQDDIETLFFALQRVVTSSSEVGG